MTEGKLTPVHPGEVLQEEFLKPLGLSRATSVKLVYESPAPSSSDVYATAAASSGLSVSSSSSCSSSAACSSFVWPAAASDSALM